MTKRLSITLLILVVVLTMSIGLAGCNEYGNIAFELKEGDDNSVAKLAGDQTAELLKNNPYRGFSIDIFMTLDKNSNSYKSTYAFPNSCKHENHMSGGEIISTYAFIEQEFKKYEKLAGRNVVLTVFLTNFMDEELADIALKQVYSLLREFRNKNISIVMKFAYQHNANDKAPKADIILKHMNKIGKWLDGQGSSLVKSTVSAFRMSFVGVDGNYYGHDYSKSDMKKITTGFAKMVPEKKGGDAYYTQSPNIDAKNSSSEYTKLINMGFFNDNFANKENEYISGGLKKTKKDYKQYVYQSRVNFNSAGVMPNANDIDGKAVLRQMKDGYFSLFNISSLLGDDATSSLLDKWSRTTITKKDLDEIGLPYYDRWFLNSDGTSHTRSVLDYIRDFVGYNLCITNLKFEHGKQVFDGVEKPTTTIKFTLTNYGMAAPLFIDKFELYIKNNETGAYINNGNGLTYPKTYDPALLVSGGQINFEQLVIGDIDIAEGNNFTPEQKAKGHSIGIKMYQRRSPNLYVRLNNDVPYSSDINWIYSTMNK